MRAGATPFRGRRRDDLVDPNLLGAFNRRLLSLLIVLLPLDFFDPGAWSSFIFFTRRGGPMRGASSRRCAPRRA